MRLRALAPITALVLAATTHEAQSSGRHDQCEAPVDEALVSLGVEASRVEDISIQIRSYNNRQDESRINGILAWVRLTDCSGHLVIDMTPKCRVKQSYTRGDCSVAGVAAY